MVPNGERAELVSWKEIAGYLGVGVRTAQVWEQERGLPVRRVPGPRCQVTAVVAELEAWKTRGIPPPPEAPQALTRRQWAGSLLLVTTVLSTGALAVHSRPGVPSRYRVEPHTLIISDVRGRELWRKQFASLDLTAYRSPASQELVWFGDLDGNGTTSVIFPFRTDHSEPPGGLIAYTNSGVERWRFTPGRTVHSSTESFARPFHPARFVVAPMGREGKLRIAVASTHDLYYPTQIALLDRDGHLLREYWHSGHLNYLLATDLTHLGWNTLIAAGISNARKAVTLLVLDPDYFTGASHEDDAAYQLQDLPAPAEIARLVFPRSCINHRLEPFTTMSSLSRDGDKIALDVEHQLDPLGSAIYYQLNPDLSLADVSVSSSFERAHLALHAQGIIDHQLTPAEIAKFRNITYLVGEHHDTSR